MSDPSSQELLKASTSALTELDAELAELVDSLPDGDVRRSFSEAKDAFAAENRRVVAELEREPAKQGSYKQTQ